MTQIPTVVCLPAIQAKPSGVASSRPNLVSEHEVELVAGIIEVVTA